MPMDRRSLTPFFNHSTIIRKGYAMDISIVATIGFTTAAVIGIVVLIFTTGRKTTGK
jgi:hypothetical protein